MPESLYRPPKNVCPLCNWRAVPDDRSVCLRCVPNEARKMNNENEVPSEQPAVWAIVSLMGHKQYAGKLTEEEKFGSKLGRLDIPEGDGFRSIYFGGGSVYSIDIVTEEVARIASKRSMPKPVEAWELPKQLPAAAAPQYRGDREAEGLDNSDIDDDEDADDLPL